MDLIRICLNFAGIFNKVLTEIICELENIKEFNIKNMLIN